MSNIVQFPRKVPELERDYMPIMRDQIRVTVEPARPRFWSTALLSAAVFTVYGLILLRFAEVL